jgi:type II secretory pathway pseudopilin PulG
VRHSLINRNRKPSGSTRQASRRAGAFMVEVVVGAVLLGIFLSSVGPVFRWIHDARRTSDRHLFAMQELAIQMEQLAALPPSQITDERLQSLSITDSTRAFIPDANLTATRQPDEDGLQRVTLELAWINDAGMNVEPKRLTAWFPPASEGGAE